MSAYVKKNVLIFLFGYNVSSFSLQVCLRYISVFFVLEIHK